VICTITIILLLFLLKIIVCQLYPEKYSELIEKYSEEYNVDSKLVYAIIKQESNFQTDACSSKGAKGLMQLMDGTAIEIAEKIDCLDVDLNNPEINIRLGIKHLADLIDRYNNEKINYPVVQSKNNEYYLTRDFYKKYNQAGSIFMDYRNNSFDDKNVVLYGHSMLDNSMFGSLQDIFKTNFFDKEENNIIELRDLDNNILKYQIFSYYIIEKEEYYITTSFKNDKEYLTFLNTLKNRSYKITE